MTAGSRYRAKLLLSLRGGGHMQAALSDPMVRLLVQVNDTFRKVCKALLPRNDLRFAIVPYSGRNGAAADRAKRNLVPGAPAGLWVVESFRTRGSVSGFNLTRAAR